MVSRSQLWSTVLSVREEEESVGTETLNEPGHSHYSVDVSSHSFIVLTYFNFFNLKIILYWSKSLLSEIASQSIELNRYLSRNNREET